MALPGLIVGGQALQQDENNQFTNRHLAQLIAARAFALQQEQALQQRQAQGRTNAGMLLPALFQQSAPPQAGPVGAPFAPPPDAMPQPPEPGQASVPMQAGPPPMGAPDGMTMAPDSMPPGAPQGAVSADSSLVPSEPSVPQAAPIPVGWQPSPAAAPELGGRPSQQQMQGADSGIGAPPPAPKIPPQLLSVPNLIKAMQDRKIPPEQMVDTLHQLEPLINNENRYAIAEFKAQTDATKAANAAYTAAINKFKAENAYRNTSSLIDTRAARVGTQADAVAGRNRLIDARIAGTLPPPGGAPPAAGGPAARPPDIINTTADQSPAGLAAMQQDRLNPRPWTPDSAVGVPTPATAGAGSGAGLTDDALTRTAEEYRRTLKLPTMTRDPLERRRIINRAAELDSAEGISPEDRVTARLDVKGVQGAYNAITKDLAAIGPYNNMLETNGNIVKDLATKAIATDAQLANRPINWLRQNATDNPAVATYLAQIRIFTTEAARVLNNPRLVGQLTDTARREMEGVVNGDMPLKATIGVIDRLTQDGKIRVGSMEDQASYLRDRLAGKKGATSPGARGPTGAPAAAAPKRIANDAEFDALPKGATFIGPDGKARIKP